MSDDDKSGEDQGMRVDTDLVRQLAEMLSDNDLTEIEVEDGDRRIVVKRKVGNGGQPAYYAPPPPPPAQAAAVGPLAPADAASASDHAGAVKSPMVGTVYLSGEPGGKPFVAAGSKVNAGDTLLIVEAMKVMNTITAPRAGTVSQVLVQDAQPVEFDQPLVIID
jgi:acetyl-CoA carboxylase biotin carboxyl carrier protein